MPFSPLDALLQVGAPKRAADSTPRTDAVESFQPALEEAYRAEAPRPAPESAAQKPATETRAAASGQHNADDQADQSAAAAEGAVVSEEAAEPESEETADAVEISEEAAAAAVCAAEKSDAKVVVAALGDAVADEQAVEKTAAAEGEKNESNVPGEEAIPEEMALDGAEAEGDGGSADEQSPKMSTFHSSKQLKRGAPAGDGADIAAETDQLPTEPVGEDATATKTDAQLQAEAAQKKAGELSTAAREQGDDGKRDGAAETPATALSRTAATTTVEVAPAQVEVAAAPDASTAEAPATTAASGTPAAATAGVDAAPRSQRALDRLMAGHASRHANEAADPNGMPTVDRARFVHRVEGAMRAAHQGDGRIQVRLSPPDLGSVKIELALQNGVLSAKLEAETPAARNLLLESLPALRERLAQQDIQIEKFDVDVRQEGGGQQGSGQTDDRASQQSGERPSGRPRTATARTATDMPSARAVATTAANSGLDVRV